VCADAESEEDGDAEPTPEDEEIANAPPQADAEAATASAVPAPEPSPAPEAEACPGGDASPWKLTLRPGFKKSCLQELHRVLRAHPGACPVEIHALGQVFYPPGGVEPSPELEAAIAKFTAQPTPSS